MIKTPRFGEIVAAVLGLVVLAAILFPVFAQNKGGPKRSVCLGNLKQIGRGLVQYAEDSDDRLPGRDVWMSALGPYLRNKDVLHCDRVPKGAHGYAFNAALDRAKPPKDPADVPMVYDSANPGRNASDRVASLPSPGRHSGTDFIAYADGHARGRRVR